MKTKIKKNISDLKDIFEIFDLEIPEKNTSNMTLGQIKEEANNILEIINKKTLDYKNTMKDLNKFITEDENYNLFIKFLKNEEIIIDVNNIKTRKSYFDYYINKDRNNKTEFNKMIESLDKNNYESNFSVKFQKLKIKLKQISQEIDKFNDNFVGSVKKYLSTKNYKIMKENIFKLHQKVIVILNELSSKLKKNWNTQEDYNKVFMKLKKTPTFDYKLKYKYNFVDFKK